MRIGEAWELRSWGGPKPTWRRVPAVLSRGHGSSIRYAVRIVTGRRAKRLQFSGSGSRPY